MRSEIETLGPGKIRIKVEIPTDEIRDKVEEKYKEVRQSVVLPGFRKGHVPRPILEKRYKKTVEQDAKVDLIEKSIAKTLEEKKIQAVGDPVEERVGSGALATGGHHVRGNHPVPPAGCHVPDQARPRSQIQNHVTLLKREMVGQEKAAELRDQGAVGHADKAVLKEKEVDRVV